MENDDMRVMIDTNVLISAVYNPASKPGRALAAAGTDYTLVLCDYIIEECREVIKRKFPHRLDLFEVLLEQSGLEFFVGNAPRGFPIADPKDQPILDAAVAADVDVLVSGDKHFIDLEIKRPRICTPAQFLDDMNRSNL
jgi:putative PIN family toxin of toxin-antitoxin system